MVSLHSDRTLTKISSFSDQSIADWDFIHSSCFALGAWGLMGGGMQIDFFFGYQLTNDDSETY